MIVTGYRRQAEATACAWCKKQQGVYKPSDKDAFRRHADCRCTVLPVYDKKDPAKAVERPEGLPGQVATNQTNEQRRQSLLAQWDQMVVGAVRTLDTAARDLEVGDLVEFTNGIFQLTRSVTERTRKGRVKVLTFSGPGGTATIQVSYLNLLKLVVGL